MIWFIIGAIIMCVQIWFRYTKRGAPMNHPVQGLAFAAVLGAATYGTILWLLAKLIF